MAGVKGKSGGPRPNSGGARPGAGRPKKQPTVIALALTYDDPEKFLRAVMNDSGSDSKLRVDAAKALMPYVHPKKGESAKGAKNDAAKSAASGKYQPKTPPKLVVNNR